MSLWLVENSQRVMNPGLWSWLSWLSWLWSCAAEAILRGSSDQFLAAAGAAGLAVGAAAAGAGAAGAAAAGAVAEAGVAEAPADGAAGAAAAGAGGGADPIGTPFLDSTQASKSAWLTTFTSMGMKAWSTPQSSRQEP